MSAVRHDRNKGRRTAVQVLYAAEITGQDPAEIARTGAAPEEVVLDEYALRLIEGVAAQKDAIDALLEECSRNWAVS
ncbi:MAG: transcription antitermination factor NusB, partial [Eggerthellaceae bacterium]|nr:transcription antitermination factor NusB [Eggerthellaceae bacterium]